MNNPISNWSNVRNRDYFDIQHHIIFNRLIMNHDSQKVSNNLILRSHATFLGVFLILKLKTRQTIFVWFIEKFLSAWMKSEIKKIILKIGIGLTERVKRWDSGVIIVCHSIFHFISLFLCLERYRDGTPFLEIVYCFQQYKITINK